MTRHILRRGGLIALVMKGIVEDEVGQGRLSDYKKLYI